MVSEFLTRFPETELNKMRRFRIFGRKTPILPQSEVICYNRHKAIYTGML